MAIKIIKKASLPKPGNCRDCRQWDQEGILEDKRKRRLGRCSRHVCYTPETGRCNAFIRLEASN